MRKMDKELIDHIKDNLQAHEEAYKPGSWERFAVQEEKKQRGFMYWPLWSAAAIILVIGSVFFLQNDKNNNDEMVINKPEQIIKNTETNKDQKNAQLNIAKSKSTQPAVVKIEKQLPFQRNIYSDNIVPATQTTKNNVPISNSMPYALADKENNLPILNDYAQQNVLSGKLSAERINSNSLAKNLEIASQKKIKPKSKTTFEELLAQDSYNNRLAKTENIRGENKWEPGVFVAPAMGNDNKVNMNYGFSLSYNLANKLSISSGIAYTALSSTNNPTQSNVSNAQSLPTASALASSNNSNKSLQSIDASVRGINIPLELKYNISDKFYTGVGVSALAILNNKQQNNYIVSQAQNTTVVNTMGYAEQRMFVVTERVSEPQSESVIAPEKYLGFYNFSLGYKQKISPKKHIAVEPFLRLPMKDFSKDNLNLTNGGLRLKLDF